MTSHKGDNVSDSPKTKLLDSALHVIRSKGYTATTVDDVCAYAGVTKGSFFHHFKSKEQLAVEAASHFGQMADRFFAGAPFQSLTDPLDRFVGYIDFRGSILQGPLAAYTCLLGTMVQEVYDTHPLIRLACEQNIGAHIAWLTRDIEAAKQLYAPDARWTSESLAAYTQAVLQGAFVLAKAQQCSAVAQDCVSASAKPCSLTFRQPCINIKECSMTPEHSQARAPELELKETIESWRKALEARDLDELVTHYADDVVVYDCKPPYKLEGPAAYREMWAACMPYMPAEFHPDHQDMKLEVSGDLAFLYGMVALKTADGSICGGSWIRITVCYRRVEGRWLVAHEHASLPFSPMTGQIEPIPSLLHREHFATTQE